MGRSTFFFLAVCFMGMASTVPVRALKHPLLVPAWVKDAVFYQIFPERFANGDTTNDPPGVERWGGEPKSNNYFGGDLKGIIEHLDYIASLGINAIYLNPIFEANSNHKYNTKDYLRIDPHFGDDRTFKQLVDGCHSRGIRIILDGVFNHTGVDFLAFQDVKRNGVKSKYRGWYNIHSFPVGPPNKPNYESWWGQGSLPKLMTDNPEVREYLFKATRHWMEFGIDGWRLDVPNEIPHEFWIEWRSLVKSINSEAYIVGEIWEDGAAWLQGDQFDAVMNYRFRDDCLDFFVRHKTTVTQFDSALEKQRSQYPEEASLALQNLVGSHDTERILTLCKGDMATARVILLFQMTYMGAPMVYYGDELGMRGGRDPGCRGTMIWEKSKQDASLLSTYRAAIKMRNENPALRRGTCETIVTDDSMSVYVFRRAFKGQTAIVAINSGPKKHRIDLRLTSEEQKLPWKQAWPPVVKSVRPFEKAIHASVPANSARVYIGGK